MSSAAGFQSFIPQEPAMAYDMTDVQQHLSSVSLDSRPWSEDADRFKQFESLKNMALGSCRLLYGSERMKFYDLVVGVDEHQSTFCVALVCSRDAASKILRTCRSDCPVKAAHAMVNQLQKDTMPLLVNYGAGSQMIGQQGYTHEVNGKFHLGDGRYIERVDGPVDDTDTLPGRRNDSYAPPRGAPRAPRADRPGYKRPRREVDRYHQDHDTSDARREHDRFSEPRTPVTDARMAAAGPGEIIGEDYYDDK